MTLVVDASVALRWFVESPGAAAAAALLDDAEVLVAPDLVVAEVSNAAWKLVRAGQIDRELGARIALAIGRSFDYLVPTMQLIEGAYSISVDLDHPVYDCLYLQLAEQEGAELVTADKRLLSRVSGTAWAPRTRAL